MCHKKRAANGNGNDRTRKVKYDRIARPQAYGTAEASSEVGGMKDLGAYVKQQVLEKEQETETNAQPVGDLRKVLKERIEVSKHQNGVAAIGKPKVRSGCGEDEQYVSPTLYQRFDA